MSAKTWMKWLSVIALILSVINLVMAFLEGISDVVFFDLPNITLVLLAIVAVIISFNKK